MVERFHVDRQWEQRIVLKQIKGFDLVFFYLRSKGQIDLES